MKPIIKKTFWQNVNDIVLVLHIIFPVWMVALMYTTAISGTLCLIAVLTSLLLGVVYKLVKKLQKGKGILIAARVITFAAIAAFYLPMVVLMCFNHTKLMYPLKRADYMYGVFGSAEYYGKLLPPKLPEACEDYSFVTKGSLVAQDYHASSYLMFHTDTAVLDEYAMHFEGMGCEPLINDPENEYVQGKIEWFCGQMRLQESFSDNLDHAVLYWFSGRYPKAVLLNYETGLVAILT